MYQHIIVKKKNAMVQWKQTNFNSYPLFKSCDVMWDVEVHRFNDT
jgi:hypothetical protein